MTKLMRACFDGHVLVPIDPVDLPTGKVLELRVEEAPDPPRGSVAAILAAIHSPPHVTQEDVDALNRAIEEGRTPPTEGGIFDEGD